MEARLRPSPEDDNVTVLETVIDGDVAKTSVVVMDDTVRLFDAETGSITFKRQLPKVRLNPLLYTIDG